MLKLMKYELRKSAFSIFVMLVALGMAELLFLFGVFFTNIEKSPVVPIGVSALIIVTVAGISFIGIESLLTLHKDLNTKQSYMLFMTPNNCYRILGAKILENALAIFFAALFFLVLAGIDITILLTKMGGFKQVILMLQQMMDIDIEWAEIKKAAAIVFSEGVISWFSMVITGYLAVILATAVFAGKKISGLVSFILYIILISIQMKITYSIMDRLPYNVSDYTALGVYGAITAAFAVIIYFVSCFMMEKKLSV